MKRATFGLCTGAVLGVAGAALAGDLCETIVYCDDFDTYATGLLVGQDCIFGTDCAPRAARSADRGRAGTVTRTRASRSS